MCVAESPVAWTYHHLHHCLFSLIHPSPPQPNCHEPPPPPSHRPNQHTSNTHTQFIHKTPFSLSFFICWCHLFVPPSFSFVLHRLHEELMMMMFLTISGHHHTSAQTNIQRETRTLHLSCPIAPMLHAHFFRSSFVILHVWLFLLSSSSVVCVWLCESESSLIYHPKLKHSQRHTTFLVCRQRDPTVSPSHLHHLHLQFSPAILWTVISFFLSSFLLFLL